MAESDPKTPRTPSSGPKSASPAAAGKLGAKAAGEAGTDALRDHVSTIALVAVIAVALTLVIVFQVRKDRQYNAAAWTALAELRQKSPTGTEGFAELAKEYRGSEADPFIRLAWAARLYEAGSREQVQEAKDLLDQVARENPGNAFVKERVATAAERVNAELTDPRAQLTAAATAAPAAGDAAPVGSGAPLEIELGDEHGPDDGHGHGPDDGHGH